MPPTITSPPDTASSARGVSIRADGLMGASVSHFFFVQYASRSPYVVRVSLVSHFVALMNP